jgi:hypothetical protein
LQPTGYARKRLVLWVYKIREKMIMIKHKTYISINITDLSKTNDPMIAMLISPVTKGRDIINVDPKHVDGMALLLDCDRERAEAIVQVIRMRYKKNQIRIYDGKKPV